MRRQAIAAFAFLAAAWGGGTAFAAPPALDIRPVVADALVQGKWQPLLVTVENNDAGEALQGEVQVALEDTRRQERLATYTAPITLPRGAATVRVPITVYVPQNALPDVSVFVVSGRSGTGDIITRRKFDKIPTLAFSLNLLAVSNAPDALHTLNGARLGVFAGSSGGLRIALPNPAAVRGSNGKFIPPPRSYGQGGNNYEMPLRVVNRPDAGVLPNRSAGYEAVSIVYLGRDVLPDTFSDAQVEALRGWVAGGGLLVAASSKLRTDERFRAWLPLPSVEQAPWGRGSIAVPVVDPADPVFSSSPQAEAFWRKTVRAGVTTRSVTNFLSTSNNYGTTFWSSLFRAPGLQAPGAGSIGVFLGAYLFLLVPLNYFVLRKLDKREWMWATAPILVIVFSLGAYGFGYATKGTQLFQNVATLVEMQAGSGEATTCGGVGLFSPRRARYDVQVNQPDAVLWTPSRDYDPYNSRSQNTEYGPLVISEGEGAGGSAGSGGAGASSRGSEISMWAMRAWAFRTSRVRLGSGIEARLSRDAFDHITGTVANHTGKPLTRVWVSFGGHGQNVGTLRDGETRPVTFGPEKKAPGSKTRPNYTNNGITQLFDPTQTDYYYSSGSAQNRSSSDPKASREAQKEAFRRAVSSGVQSASYDSNNGNTGSTRPTEAFVTALNEDALLPITVDGQTVPSGMNVNILLIHVPLIPAH